MGAFGISRGLAALDIFPGFDELLARREKSVQSCDGMLYTFCREKRSPITEHLVAAVCWFAATTETNTNSFGRKLPDCTGGEDGRENTRSLG